MVWHSEIKDHLVVANSRSGTLSLVDVEARKVVTERPVAESISDMMMARNQDQILILDPKKHGLQIVNLSTNDFQCSPSDFIPLAHDPRKMVIHPEKNLIAVASKWSRRITLLSKVIENAGNTGWRLEDTINLTFAPGHLVFVPHSNRLLISSAFNGLLILLDLDTQETILSCELPINNIANLSFASKQSPSTLWLSGESLNSYATTMNPEVTWGVLMDNQVRSIPMEQLMDINRPVIHLGTVYGMGDETGPGGDPGKVIVKSDGALITALQGVDRIAIRPQLPRSYTDRIKVGDRPMDMLLNEDETLLYVLNHFSDSISVVDLEKLETTDQISLGPQPEFSKADLGERLFFDATLSLRGWYSCHSCHTEGHTTGLLNDNLGDDHFGSPKRILSLLGTHSNAPFSWLGKVNTLEGQISKSLEKTMLHRGSIQDKSELLAAYLRTLESPPSVNVARRILNPKLVEEGEKIFQREGCNECHKRPNYTSTKTFNVGLVDKAGNSEFNPPSLRGLSQRNSFLHDNSANSVEDLLFNQKHPDPSGPDIHKNDRAALLHFLNSL